MTEKLVIIGNGMAAARLVAKLTESSADHDITVIGDEPGYAYNRVLLSSLLAGGSVTADLDLKPSAWWGECGASVISGVAAVAIDWDAQNVVLADARCVAFDKLVFATGSRALRLPVEGANLPQVHVYRTWDDTRALEALGAASAQVAVIGGGLLGIEAAYGLAKRGAKVTLVHIMDRLMERQLDAGAAAIVRDALETLGISVILGAQTSSIHGNDKVEGLSLADGRVIPADAVVMTAGVKPNAELARDAGLAVNRGIVVNEQLEASRANVYAIGECAEAHGQCCGLVEPAYAQADVLANLLCGGVDAGYTPAALSTNLKVSGLPVFSTGDFLGGDGTSSILLRDPSAGLYKKFVTRDGLLTGAVLVGDTGDAPWYLKLIRERTPISAFRSGLAFGEAYCQGAPLLTLKKAA